MVIKVHLLAFDSQERIREVKIDGDQFFYDNAELLEEVFEQGQNDFQPQQMPSVSAGDVILLERRMPTPNGNPPAPGIAGIMTEKWLIKMMGFYKLTDEEYEQYKAMPQTARTFSKLVMEK